MDLCSRWHKHHLYYDCYTVILGGGGSDRLERVAFVPWGCSSDFGSVAGCASYLGPMSTVDEQITRDQFFA
jgi:hypothetical protein